MATLAKLTAPTPAIKSPDNCTPERNRWNRRSRLPGRKVEEEAEHGRPGSGAAGSRAERPTRAAGRARRVRCLETRRRPGRHPTRIETTGKAGGNRRAGPRRASRGSCGRRRSRRSESRPGNSLSAVHLASASSGAGHPQRGEQRGGAEDRRTAEAARQLARSRREDHREQDQSRQVREEVVEGDGADKSAATAPSEVAALGDVAPAEPHRERERVRIAQSCDHRAAPQPDVGLVPRSRAP